MFFFISMFICNILIPLVMVTAGYMIDKNPPKNINHFVGYRTKMSKKNKDTWKYAHEYFAKLWVKTGIILLILSILVQIPLYHCSEKVIGNATVLIEVIQIACIFVTIYLVEKELKRTFDDKGRRR